MAKDIKEISKFIEKIKFKKKLLGGIDELDALEIIEKLNLEYKELYTIQEVQIKTLKERLDGKK